MTRCSKLRCMFIMVSVAMRTAVLCGSNASIDRHFDGASTLLSLAQQAQEQPTSTVRYVSATDAEAVLNLLHFATVARKCVPHIKKHTKKQSKYIKKKVMCVSLHVHLKNELMFYSQMTYEALHA